MNSKGLASLAKVNLARSEAGAHHVFKQFGQSIEVSISKTNLQSKKDFPYVTFTAWLKYLVEFDLLDHLVGVRDVASMRKILSTFWSRYVAIYPQHIVGQRNDPGFSKDCCIPVLYHGDEGRGLKKKQLMVLSVHGALGKGCHHSNNNDSENPEGPLRMNFIGNTYLTHFLQCVLPISLYNETLEDFYHMLDLQAKEFQELFHKGVVIRNQRFFICCIGVKGDAPFLSKSGMFERSFTRRPTRPTSKKPATGICHLCCAGKEDYLHPVPFEQYGVKNPIWLQTVGIEKPYADPSPLLQIPCEATGTTENLWKYDLFHNFHSGMGKYFASSAVCICLELVGGHSIDEAFESLTEDFMRYCRVHKESPYHKKLTKTMFGVEASFQDCPDAAWSKGDFTRLIIKWFDNYCSRCVIGQTNDPLYLKCVAYLCLELFVVLTFCMF